MVPSPTSPPVATELAGTAVTATAAGPATVVTYCVVHGRDGEAESGLVVGDLPDGSRTYARVDDPALLVEMEATEWVGADVTLATGPGDRNAVVT